MTRTAILLSALAGLLLTALPASAQRVFVSGSGNDSNPCTYAAPCRSFQQAFSTVAPGGEIDVLDPAGYGPLTISNAISIQAHGFGGITQTGSSPAIEINAGTSDDITLNGLLIDGEGSGINGIVINRAGSVQILNCVVRHFVVGGISSSFQGNLLVSDTIVSDNQSANGIGMAVIAEYDKTVTATLSGITANDNGEWGVWLSGGGLTAMVTNSVMTNNAVDGLYMDSGTAWLGTSVISGNNENAVAITGGTLNSYQNNAINGNVLGSLTPASTQ